MISRCALFAFSVLAALLAPGATRAQESAGAVIVLPRKLVTGQRATLAVLDDAGRLVSGASVAFTGGEHVVTDVTGRASFTAPAEPGVLFAQLPGHVVTASATVIAPPPNSPDGVQLSDYPRVILVSDRCAVDGFGFRGEADANHVMLGDQPALVLAASPVALVLLPGPGAGVGPGQLLMEVGGRSPGPVPVTLVSLELSAPKKQLAPREKSKLAVYIRGTSQPLEMEARNLTPEVVKLPRGNVQRVISAGGESNTAEIEMQGLRAGDFSVSVRLVPGMAGLPDIETARYHVLAARRLATREWQVRLDRLIRRMERSPKDALRVQHELEKMLAQQPEGEFGRLLEAAWRTLLKH